MVRTYIQFCQDFNLTALNPSVRTILSYLEFLAQRMKSPKTVSNYWAAVKLLHATANAKFNNMETMDVQLMLRSISMTKRHISTQKLPLSKEHITKMCEVLDTYGSLGVVVKCALLFGFYAFLRASNLCPPDHQTFDDTRHFTRSDVTVNQEGIVLALKWAKNLQSTLQPKLVAIPKVDQPIVDPVSTYQRMCSLFPASPEQPLFMLDATNFLTISRFRKTFTWLCQTIDIQEHKFSLHSLRRGGATCAYRQGADMLDIQRQGAWASTAFLNYITSRSPHKSSVCAALAK